MSEPDEGLKQAFKAAALLSGIGVHFAVIVGLCVYLGSLVDDNLLLGGNVGKITGIIAAFPIAFYTLYRQLKQLKLI